MRIDSKYKNAIFLSSIVLLLILAFFTNRYVIVVAFAICICGFIAMDNDTIICDMFFLLPFSTIFKTSNLSTSLVTILSIYIIVIFLARKRLVIKADKVLLTGLLFVWFIIVGDLLNGAISIISIIKHLSGIYLVFFILKEIKEVKAILIYYGLGVYISSAVALFANYIPNFYNFVEYTGHNAVIITRFSGMNGDPNYYTVSLLLVLMGALALYKERKMYFVIAFIATCFFGFQTYSKSFFVAIIIAVVVIIFELLKSKNNKLIAAAISILIIVGIVLSISGQISAINLVVDRFTSAENLSELTTGRTNLWQEYLLYIFDNWTIFFYGKGISAPLLGNHGAHNFIIELLYYFGIVGSVLFMIFVVTAYKKATNGTRGKVTVGKLTIIIIGGLFLGLQMLFSNELYFQLAYMYIICKYDVINHDCKNQLERLNEFTNSSVSRKNFI